MGKKKRRRIIISFILLLCLFTSFFLYIRGNEYRIIAWKRIDKSQKKYLLNPYLSTVKTVKLNQRCELPDACQSFACGNYENQSGDIVKDEILIYFNENVPEIIRRIKIGLMDGVIVDRNEYLKDFYCIRIDGIGYKNLNKLVKKLKHDPLISAASQNGLYRYDDPLYCTDKENIQDRNTVIVTYYTFYKFKIYRFFVIIVKDNDNTYFSVY